LTVVNNGPVAAENVTVSDPLPTGVGFVSVTSSSGTCTGGSTISCSLGTMAVGATVSITITVSTSLDTPEQLSNTATVDTTTDESDLTNNQDTEPTTVVKPLGRIVIEKQTLPDGAVDTFDFSGALTGTLGDDETMEGDVASGIYDVTENLPPASDLESHWELDGIVCDDDDSAGDVETATATITVDPGETVKCTFTNLFVEVLPQFIDRPDKPKPDVEPPAVLPAQLPFTGSNIDRLLPLAILLVLVGSALLLALPRRRSEIGR
jgi:hypothetical protein